MFDAGRLRERITIQRLVETANGKGGYSTGWGDVATVSAEVLGLDGRESVMDEALQCVSVFKLTIRWRDDVRASDQLSSAMACFGRDSEGNVRNANIRSIADPDGRRHWLTIIADTAATRS